MPFLGLSGGLRRGKRACILEQECGFLFGLLGEGRGVKKGQAVRGFRTGMKKIVV